MDSYDKLPDAEIQPLGEMSKKFLELKISSFKEACLYVHNMDYGLNTSADDKMILFKDNRGTCSTKHGVIATLAEELDIPLYKYECVYMMNEKITTGIDEILKKFEIPYVPMGHCFLVYEDFKFDLTEGNNNGKKVPINEYIHAERVDPFISSRDEYRFLRKVVLEIIVPSEEMKGITKKMLLKARTEALMVLTSHLDLPNPQ